MNTLFRDIFSYTHFCHILRSTSMFSFFPEDLLKINILSIVSFGLSFLNMNSRTEF